jgi:hypothetical protein
LVPFIVLESLLILQILDKDDISVQGTLTEREDSVQLTSSLR